VQIFEAIAEKLEWLDRTILRMVEEHASSIQAMIQDERAELKKAAAERAAAAAEREKASADLDKIIRLLEAERDAERDAKEELEAKNAELEGEIAEMKERVTARKLKKKQEAI